MNLIFNVLQLKCGKCEENFEKDDNKWLEFVPRLVIIIPDKRRTTIWIAAHLPYKIKTAPQLPVVRMGYNARSLR